MLAARHDDDDDDFRKVIITGDIFKMFRTWNSFVRYAIKSFFFVVNPSHTWIFLFVSTILYDHLVYYELIFATICFFYSFVLF